MKALVYTKYGPPDVLQLKEIERPAPKDNEVLIEVHAVSLNASDWEFLTGTPLYARVAGILKPRRQILGSDIAGRVEAVGRNAMQFQPGDEVFGDILACMGGFAEYVCAPENTVTIKPASMTFEQVAALPQGACIALQGIRDKGQVRPGHKVLINGAGGSAGSFAVQIAKSFGAEVTGVDNGEKLDFMRSFLRSLARRGLRGVKLLISDDHKGLKAAATRILGATWQRCRVHFARNLLAHAGRQGRRVVSAFVATAFAQEDADSAKAQWRQVADQLRPKVPKLAVLMDDAEHEVLAYMTFVWTPPGTQGPI